MKETLHLPRLMIAAPKSGSGKTFVTCGLLRLLQESGRKVSAFKCGPDYIDPMFHKQVLQMPSKNLDTYFTGESVTRALFAESARKSDISVIEGVMGYFDGIGMTDFTASSYDLARVTKTPVILVVDAAGQSHSVVALIKGFLEYGEERLIQGIILNRISPMLFPAMKECIEKELPVKVLGFLPKCPQCVWQSRHLGLLLPGEVADLQHQIGELSAKLKESLDLETLLALAEQAPDLECEREMREETAPDSKVRIGVAQDEAFCFYYEDNLRLLEKMGARLVPFSPLHDRELPAVDGLLLGGGYPELHCGELSANHGMLGDICKAAGRKMPMLAECGGFLYLQKSMTDMSGNTWKMADVLHGTVQPTGKLVRFGYLELTGHRIRGHEFHYFDCSENGSADRAVKPGSGRSWDCMVEENGIIAGFPHLYYYSNPEFVRQFLQHCAAYRDAQERIGS